MFLVTLMVKKLLARFLKKKLQKVNQEEFRMEKVREKDISCMSNGKAMKIRL